MIEVNEKGTWWNGKDGAEHVSNFSAEIQTHIRYHDGDRQVRSELTLTGQHGKDELPPITIPAAEFPAMSWPNPHWGYHLLIFPGGTNKERLRLAIQQKSKPELRDVYTSTGWMETKHGWTYLLANGGIHSKGADTDIEISLPNELRRFRHPSQPFPPNLRDTPEVLQHTLGLVFTAPEHVAWTMLAACFRPTLGQCDFGVHLAGRTGTFKSEYASLIQSHYGATMDARNLPASWSSTGNALEALAYRAKDAVMVIDDYVPIGTAYHLRSLAKTADQLFRAQGNQQGRSRLTDSSDMQQMKYPRGLLLSTGEDIPEGHSVRARMMVLELSPGDIDPANLTKAQASRTNFPIAMSAWLQWIARHWDDVHQQFRERVPQLRKQYLDVGHQRTPHTIAQLIATIELLLKFAHSARAITKRQHASMVKNAIESIEAAAALQQQYLTTADPCQQFVGAVQGMITSNQFHLRTRDGGVPENAERFGWIVEDTLSSIPTYKSMGKVLGWISADELLLDANIVYEAAKRFSRGELTLTKQTMLKRLRDAGMLSRTDAARQRNTVRAQCQGAVRTVIAMPLSHFIEEESADGQNEST